MVKHRRFPRELLTGEAADLAAMERTFPNDR
jgi:hypothetical protein